MAAADQDFEKDPGDVFAIPDLWGPDLNLSQNQDTSFLFADISLQDNTITSLNEKIQAVDNVGFFAFPDFSLGAAEVVDSSATPILHEIPELATPTKQALTVFEEIWPFTYDEPSPPRLQSWDTFDNENMSEPQTIYITEAGADVFDASLDDNGDPFKVKNNKTLVVETLPFASALLGLGLGRSSVFFYWNESTQRFQNAFDNVRISGCTTGTLDGVIDSFTTCGNATRSLQEFVDRSYEQSKSSTRIALADSVSTIVSTLQSNLNIPTRSLSSVLQLQERFRLAIAILARVNDFVHMVSSTDNDEIILSKLFEQVQRVENEDETLKAIFLAVFERVSEPWLEFTSQWLGIKMESGIPFSQYKQGRSFVNVDAKSVVDGKGQDMQESDYIFNPDAVPTFLSEEDSTTLFETGRSLRYLRDNHPDHPIAVSEVIESARPPSFDWKFTWEDIEDLQQRALQYESDLKAAMKQYAPHEDQPSGISQNNQKYELSCFGKDEDDMLAHLLASIKQFDSQLASEPPNDRLKSVVTGIFCTDTQNRDKFNLDPPVSICPSLSFSPIVSAQARVVNSVCMQMFFKSHKLREHLTLQRQFQLLGDGIFSSRLSHALFDSNLETAERQKGVVRSGVAMGLRLGTRESWPPAGSELRLALMGILTESYLGWHGDTALNHTDGDELPGGLSFSVREMSDAEMDQCMNIDSIYALDFLRLSYKPPRPLEAILTPGCLYKYDQIFKLLLRISRLLFVVNQLSRGVGARSAWPASAVTARFCYEAKNLITSIAGYFFDTGIDSTWMIFERKLDLVEKRLETDDFVLGQHEGLDNLRQYHEKVLDRIMFSLLLRKRQQPVMSLLEEIFGLILTFAKCLQETESESREAKIHELYLKFSKKIGVFVTVCKGLSEKRGYGERKGDEEQFASKGGIFDTEELKEENTITQLLVRLDIGGHYSKR